MKTSLKLVVAILFPFLIYYWLKEGNLKEILVNYGLVLVATGSALTALIFLLTLSKPSANIFSRIIIWAVLSAIPLSFVLGNPLKISIQFLIIYSVGLISLFLIFTREIKNTLARFKI